MRRQQGMRLDEWYVSYLQMVGLYHLARLNDRWFWIDEPLLSAFMERWSPETHTFHMPFGECTITLQDVAYQLGLAVDGRYVSGYLTDFHIYIEGGCLAWVWFEELLGVIPPPSQVQKFAVNCSWFKETFGECPKGADEDTVWRFARAYIMMLLGTHLFADKSGNRIHIRWLPYVARLEEMGSYSWGSTALAWLYRCMCRVANQHVMKLLTLASRWSGYNPFVSEKGPRVQMWRLQIDMLQPRDFIWMPYSSPEGSTTVRWCPAPSALQHWHLHWESRADHVLRFDVVADPRPLDTYLDWWCQLGKRFLSPEMYLGDPRGVPIPVEASQRGPGLVPDMDRVDDVPDRRQTERRARLGTRRSQREWRWLDQAIQEADEAGWGCGRGRGMEADGGRLLWGTTMVIFVTWPVGEGLQSGLLVAIMAGRVERGMLSEIPLPIMRLDLGRGPSKITSLVFPMTTRHFRRFLDEISAIMQEDEAARGRSQTMGTQGPLDVDLNDPPSVPPPDYFALGGTPASAHTAGSHSVAGPSSSRPLRVQPRTPAHAAPQDEEDEIEDDEPLIRRGQRT
ncbi:uncharacterized protein DS421_4g119540 [Arachis hypogaea]|nr:uncharacterized protein DS421_4g119540 [Arachis hypogaea]